MALGDLMASRLVHSSLSPSPSSAAPSAPLPNHHHHSRVTDGLAVANGPEPRNGLEAAEVERPAPVAYLPQVVVLCEQRHEGLDEAAAATGPSTSGLVSKWRPKDRVMDAIQYSDAASADSAITQTVRWIRRVFTWGDSRIELQLSDPFSMAPPKALENIGKTLHTQYERWQPKARYKLQLDPTVEEVKKLCNTCRKYAKSERVLFHYNGHGVPKPTTNGEIWVFNKSYTQYIPLPITDLDSWLKTPSIYVFDCSAAGIIVKAFLEPSPFFTEQLTAFEVWLDHGSEDKKPPEQLPIVLQVLLSQSHRFRALVLLGRFLDMGPWAVDLSCQVDLVKDGGHAYFVRFLDSLDAYPEQRAMAAFVLAVIVDGHRRGQEVCINAGLIDVCLRHLQPENPRDAQSEPLLLQWLCLCLGKLWEDFPEAQLLGLHSNAPEILIYLLSEPQPEVRAAAVFALGNLLDMGSTSVNGVDDDSDDDEKLRAEINVVRSLLQISSDASPLVRSEAAIALTRFALGHNKHLKSVAAEYWKPQTNSLLKSRPSLANISSPNHVYSHNNIIQGSSGLASHIGPVLRVGSDSSATGRDGRISSSSPIATNSVMHGSPHSDDSSQHSDSGILLKESASVMGSNGGLSYTRSRPVDGGIYSQFISTMCSVAKDPYPRIATIGETSTPPSNFGMARSSSWFDMNSACKMTSQIASWDTRFESGTKATLLLPFSPIVVAADENEQIRVWNYEDALPVNSFQHHKLSDRGLSKLLLINELDESLLLAASSDGNVRVWENFTQKGGQKLVTAFSSIQGHRAAGRSIVIDWQQQSGYLSSADSAISALSASQVRPGHFAAGFADGSVRIFDVRSPDRLIYMAKPHAPRTEKVVGIGFQPGFDPYKIVSASQAGDIQFLDVRRAAEPYLTIEAHRGSLTALAVHRHAPIVASGSAKQMIKVFSLEGEQLTIIRYQPSFMGQRIGSVNCLSFHPYKSLLAAGAGDNALVSIYAEENYK
ncbi:hypothetical protein HU200_012820 [Digitaria exilis]|uniref:Raptor N-terminal CASPase-like domain-containing protein n=1 Tax=Digitaria exilis TaxID=1010633 RepID=A0A835FET3_9POAL|nr:hypothetical protein HU200_012820 [Digitaria exilis]